MLYVSLSNHIVATLIDVFQILVKFWIKFRHLFRQNWSLCPTIITYKSLILNQLLYECMYNKYSCEQFVIITYTCLYLSFSPELVSLLHVDIPGRLGLLVYWALKYTQDSLKLIVPQFFKLLPKRHIFFDLVIRFITNRKYAFFCIF